MQTASILPDNRLIAIALSDAFHLGVLTNEKAGHIRWLRPDFQNPVTGNTLLNNELTTYTGRWLQANLALETPEKHKKSTKTRANSQTSLAESEVKVWGNLSFPLHDAQDVHAFVHQILIHEK